MFGFDYLISPLKSDVFLSQYKGMKAVVIEGDDHKFDGLLDWETINSTLDVTRSSFEGARLIYEKNELHRNELQRLNVWLNKGATLVLNQVNQIDSLLNKFSSLLAKDLNTGVNTNAYISFPAKQGFNNHYDRHDVFVVQVEGTKLWNVFEPTHQYPLHLQDGYLGKGEPPDSDSYIEYEMTPGDVLYIPRGHWHYAISTSPSIHLTVGPQSRSAADFMQWYLPQIIQNDEFLRVDFPLADISALNGNKSDAELDEHISILKDKMGEYLQEDIIKEQLIRFSLCSNPVRDQYNIPSNWNINETIDIDTEFTVSDEQKSVLRYDDDESTGTAYIRGHLLQLNDAPKPALEYIFGKEQVVSGRKILDLTPALEWEKIKKILIQLTQCGYLILSPKD